MAYFSINRVPKIGLISVRVDLRKSTRAEIRPIFGINKAYFSIDRPYFCTCPEYQPYFCTCGLVQAPTYRNKTDILKNKAYFF